MVSGDRVSRLEGSAALFEVRDRVSDPSPQFIISWSLAKVSVAGQSMSANLKKFRSRGGVEQRQWIDRIHK
jgi:hypothetical protein